MDADIKDGALGSEGLYDLDIKDGNLVLVLSHGSKGLSASINVQVESGYFLDKLAAKIPGDLDDAVINLIKNAIKG
jgi:hypothetical protein